MIGVTLFLLARVTDPNILRQLNAPPNVFEDLIPKREILGKEPHTLVISDGQAMKSMEYRSGPACQRARDSVRRQLSLRAPATGSAGVVVAISPPRVTVFCVPR